MNILRRHISIDHAFLDAYKNSIKILIIIMNRIFSDIEEKIVFFIKQKWRTVNNYSQFKIEFT